METCLESSVSFRDPDAVLIRSEGRIFRLVRPDRAADFARMLQCASVIEAMDSGAIVRTWAPDRSDLPAHLASASRAVYEHEAIPFVSYPGEWSPPMLSAAAELTLDLAERLLQDGLILKDATPANVLFRGAAPVFVDVASIAFRPRGAYLWLARQQFEATFVLPLVVSAEAGIPLAWSLQDPVAGLSHGAAARMLGLKRWLPVRCLIDVALPASVSGRAAKVGAHAAARRLANDRQAHFILQRSFRGLRGRLGHWSRAAARTRTAWQSYAGARGHYADQDLARKLAFVARALAVVQPRWVLDVGANTGEFSAMAARSASVVALESDVGCASAIYRCARDGRLDVQPLVVDFARPTSPAGWRNREALSLTDRMQQRFDLVLMLAVMHHVRVTAGVPVPMILDLIAEISRVGLLLEHVPPSDPMFARIARGRESLYSDCEPEEFERHLQTRFDIEECERLANGRTLYLARCRC